MRLSDTDPLRAMWAQQREGVAGRITVLERAVTALLDGELDEDLRRAAERAAHRLAGSLGTFGFMRAADRARELELAFEARGALDAGQVPTLSELVLQLEQDLHAVPAAASAATPAASRALVVTHDPALFDPLAAHLDAPVPEVVTLADAREVLTALAESDPDVLVVDLDMRAINGAEVCRVVRHEPRWAALPVIALTTGTERETIARVFAAGADDWVAKPILGRDLAARIAHRLDRTRAVGEAVHVDGLTGVATRARATEEIARLARLAERFEQPLALAFVALDEPEADDVLRRVGRRLRQRFRGEDAIGRWDAGTFVLAMLGMPREDAIGRVAELVEAFRDEPFAVAARATLSAGVAEMPADAPDLAALHLAAEHALARARAAGGDRVVRAALDARAHAETVEVVVVAQHESTAQLILAALETRGYLARRLPDGESAASALGGRHPRLRPRVIVIDADLPAPGGLALLAELARAGALRRTGALILTPAATDAAVLQGLELSGVDHLAKPFDLPELMRKVRRLMGS